MQPHSPNIGVPWSGWYLPLGEMEWGRVHSVEATPGARCAERFCTDIVRDNVPGTGASEAAKERTGEGIEAVGPERTVQGKCSAAEERSGYRPSDSDPSGIGMGISETVCSQGGIRRISGADTERVFERRAGEERPYHQIRQPVCAVMAD